jgi:predicted nucleic acid-binding protein
MEVAAALARREAPAAVVTRCEADLAGSKFVCYDVTPSLIDRAVTVAKAARLRAYDALYVALALQENARLATLDDEVRARLQQCYAGLLVE